MPPNWWKLLRRSRKTGSPRYDRILDRQHGQKPAPGRCIGQGVAQRDMRVARPRLRAASMKVSPFQGHNLRAGQARELRQIGDGNGDHRARGAGADDGNKGISALARTHGGKDQKAQRAGALTVHRGNLPVSEPADRPRARQRGV